MGMLIYLVIGVGGMIPAILWHGDSPPTRPLLMIGILVVLMVVELFLSAKTAFSTNLSYLLKCQVRDFA